MGTGGSGRSSYFDSKCYYYPLSHLRYFENIIKIFELPSVKATISSQAWNLYPHTTTVSYGTENATEMKKLDRETQYLSILAYLLLIIIHIKYWRKMFEIFRAEGLCENG